MTKEKTIKVLQNIEDRAVDFPYMTACDWVAIAAAKRHLQEEPVSEDLERAAKRYGTEGDEISGLYIIDEEVEGFKAGAQWQKEHLWKPADGNDLPEYEREVVVFTQNFPEDAGIVKVAIAHRPNPKGWDGKNIATGEVEHYTPKTYGKGGWNIPDVIFWLDVDLPKTEEF